MHGLNFSLKKNTDISMYFTTKNKGGGGGMSEILRHKTFKNYGLTMSRILSLHFVTQEKNNQAK